MTPRNVRIAVGGISHETNTFSPTGTGIDAFRDYMWLNGNEIQETLGGTRTYVGGMIAAAADVDAHLVLTFVGDAPPSGTISASAFRALLDELLASLRAAMPVDAVALALHGAGVAEDCDDIEARILEEVRSLVGPTVPIAATLDLHANVTPAMVDAADGLFGVHRYPHVDCYESGAKAIRFLGACVLGEVRPQVHATWLPMMLPSVTTELEPMLGLRKLCDEWEARPSVIDCTMFHGFAMTDSPAVGVTVFAMTDGDPDLARTMAEGVADRIWETRDGLLPAVLEPGEAVARAVELDSPVIINETSDNPGGGSPGDATYLLRALVEADVVECCFGFLCDPESVRQAIDVGVGARALFTLGGKTDGMHGAPVRQWAYVKSLSDGRFTYTTPMLQGVAADLGPMARLQLGGIDLLVSSKRQQVFDPEVFLLNGIDIARYRIVALKSAHHFRAGFGSQDRQIVTSDARGLTSQRITRLGHQRIRRPIWPLDPDTVYEPGQREAKKAVLRA